MKHSSTKLSNLLGINNLIYSLQSGFEQKDLTTPTLITLTEVVRQTLDEGWFGCGIFVDLQKNIRYCCLKILLLKLEHDAVGGVFSYWFKPYLSHHKQFVSINVYNSNLIPISYGVPLGLPLFLVFIDDPHKTS